MSVDTPRVPRTPFEGHGGLRGVVLGEHDSAPCLKIVASPTASYLYPDLVTGHFGISLGGSGTGRLGGVMVLGDSMVVGVTARDDIREQLEWSGFKKVIERFAEGLHHESARPAVQPLAVSVTPPRQGATLTERDAAVGPLPVDASVEHIASRIYELSGMSDARLAALFKVTRETFNRWRSGAMTNPTAGTRRRLGMVLRLFEELSIRGVRVNEWLLNPSGAAGVTPYDLLHDGRIDEAAYLAAAAGGAAMPAERLLADEEPLDFEPMDADDWQTFEIEVTSDED